MRRGKTKVVVVLRALACSVAVGGIAALITGAVSAAERELTAADIPPQMPGDLRRLVERTFSRDAIERADAATEIGRMHGRGAAGVPFVIRLLYDPIISLVRPAAENALAAIGEQALEPLLAVSTRHSRRQLEAIACLRKFEAKFSRTRRASRAVAGRTAPRFGKWQPTHWRCAAVRTALRRCR